MHFRLVLAAVSLPVLLGAVAVPKASGDPAVNLQRYLHYQTDGTIDFTCKKRPHSYVCDAGAQRIEPEDANATATVAFGHLQIRFGDAVEVPLQKPAFGKTLEEIEKVEKQMRRYLAADSGSDLIPPSSPRQDALDRALVGNLEHFDIKKLDIENSDPKSHITIADVAFDNRMKKTAKGAAFSERIFGSLSLSYTDALIDANDSESFYGTLPALLENWLGTHDEARAKYVGKRLETLYQTQTQSPASGQIAVETAYLGNDRLSIDVKASEANRLGSKAVFTLGGDIYNISSLFKPARKPMSMGTPDFLFRTMHLKIHTKGDDYRALLKKDKRFAGYIGEYTLLLRKRFDDATTKFRSNPVLADWFTQAKEAFSKAFEGKADTFEMTVKNRSGVTAMQVFGMVMGQLMVMAPQQNAANASAPDEEKIIAETAAQNLDVTIRTY